ncbi:hypothetical protein K7432_001693 [Basidiobolus ranarum]|uniref:Myb-like domain-containing protein n=1 Tax=Basidiobolus ranarum TaxID=34480 RepID=A0ABR2X2L6_9FUNG
MSTIGRSWETAETKMLINLRQDMDHEFSSVKRNAPLWMKISDHINSAGYQRTDKQCKEKWKNLLSEFKRAEMQKESEQRAFPYYEVLKDFLSRQSSYVESPTQPLEESAAVNYSSSPTPVSRLMNERGPAMGSCLPPVNLLPPVGYSSVVRYSPSAPAFSYHTTRSPSAHIPTPIYKSLTRELVDHEFVASPVVKRRRSSSDSEKSYSIVLGDIVELLRREIGERRKWEEKLEVNRVENERRRERQEKRRERREKDRLERQHAQTLLLVAIASRIMPNVGDLIHSANIRDVASSDSDRNENAADPN